MYVIIDKDHKIVAMSDDKKIVKKYIQNVELSNKGESLTYCKVKTKEIQNDDLLLVRYGHTYIQKGYIQYLDMANNQMAEDEQFAMDILIRMIEMYDIKKKDVNTLKKAIVIIDKYRRAESEYTPNLNQLNSYKDNYDRYLHQIDKIERGEKI